MIRSPYDSIPSLRRGTIVNGAQAQDFQFALAVWRNYIRGISNLLIQQRATNRRGGRNLPGSHVRLLAGHNVVLDLLILSTVVNLYRRAEANFVLGNVVHVDHGKVSQTLPKLAYPGLDELLALLGHVVLGVFAQVAQGGGLLDLLGEFMDQLVLEGVDFVLQFSTDLLSHFLPIINGEAEAWRE